MLRCRHPDTRARGSNRLERRECECAAIEKFKNNSDRDFASRSQALQIDSNDAAIAEHVTDPSNVEQSRLGDDMLSFQGPLLHTIHAVSPSRRSMLRMDKFMPFRG